MAQLSEEYYKYLIGVREIEIAQAHLRIVLNLMARRDRGQEYEELEKMLNDFIDEWGGRLGVI